MEPFPGWPYPGSHLQGNQDPITQNTQKRMISFGEPLTLKEADFFLLDTFSKVNSNSLLSTTADFNTFLENRLERGHLISHAFFKEFVQGWKTELKGRLDARALQWEILDSISRMAWCPEEGQLWPQCTTPVLALLSVPTPPKPHKQQINSE